MAVTELTDGVVTLRAHVDEDVDGVVAMATDPETVRFTRIPVPYGPSDARSWIHEVAPSGWRDRTAFRWAVQALDGDTPRYAGNVDLHADPVPFIGFGLAPWARGRGVMARAVRLATRWGFESERLPVVHWWAQAGNTASWRVAHACGFSFDGVRPLSVPRHEGPVDGWFASLRPTDEPVPRNTWWPVPVLEGRRVRLRAHTAADLPRIAEASADERTRQWLPHLPHPYTEETARQFVLTCRLKESRGDEVAWTVADPEDDRLLANVAVFGLNRRTNRTDAEMGYWAHPDARGRGVVGEAVELVVAHAFTPVAEGGLGRHRVQIVTAWSNTASRHVAERAGFTLVGRHREAIVTGAASDVREDGAWYDRLAPR